MAQEKIITPGNITSVFKPTGISFSAIKAGMLLSFSYTSPEGVHDKAPLVYVVERQTDGIYGLNLHYEFPLLGGILKEKRKELEKYTKPVIKSTTAKPPITKPTGPTTLRQVEQEKAKIAPVVPLPKIPLQLLETFKIATKPERILRHYLSKRMSSVSKLVYRVA